MCNGPQGECKTLGGGIVHTDSGMSASCGTDSGGGNIVGAWACPVPTDAPTEAPTAEPTDAPTHTVFHVDVSNLASASLQADVTALGSLSTESVPSGASERRPTAAARHFLKQLRVLHDAVEDGSDQKVLKSQMELYLKSTIASGETQGMLLATEEYIISSALFNRDGKTLVKVFQPNLSVRIDQLATDIAFSVLTAEVGDCAIVAMDEIDTFQACLNAADTYDLTSSTAYKTCQVHSEAGCASWDQVASAVVEEGTMVEWMGYYVIVGSISEGGVGTPTSEPTTVVPIDESVGQVTYNRLGYVLM